MALPLVGTAVLYYTLERIDRRVSRPGTVDPPPPPTPRPKSIRSTSTSSYTPKVTKSVIVQPVSSSTSDPSSPPAQRPPRPSVPSSALTPPRPRPRPRTSSSTTTSRRSSISSVGAHSTRTTSTMTTTSGFHPVSNASSKPLPPVLHHQPSSPAGSSASASTSTSRLEPGLVDGFESYFDVRLVPTATTPPRPRGGGGGGGEQRRGGSESGGSLRILKGKGKVIDGLESDGIGLGLPSTGAGGRGASAKPRSTTQGAARVDGEGGIDRNKVSPNSTTTTTKNAGAGAAKRSFSLPSLFKRKSSSSLSSPAKSQAVPPTSTTAGKTAGTVDAKERLRQSMAAHSGR